jgi:hypothetical protein
MRRLWLLVLVVPVLVVATTPPTPTSGQITFPTVNLSNEDQYINIEECGSATATIHLAWVTAASTTASITATPQSYVLYAANKISTGDCPITSDSSTSLIAGKVATVPVTPTNDVEFSTSAIAAAAFGPTACSSTAAHDGQPIYLCMQAKDSTLGAGSNIGAARATLTLALSRPAIPVIGRVLPGEGAANVDWSAGANGAADTSSYVLQATPVGTTAIGARTSPRVTTTNYRLTGLTNDVPYNVTVTAYSPASNPSDPSLAVSVTPSHVLDFFSMYQDAGGQEQGGCSGGPAGPVALLAASLALLAVRRKKK